MLESLIEKLVVRLKDIGLTLLDEWRRVLIWTLVLGIPLLSFLAIPLIAYELVEGLERYLSLPKSSTGEKLALSAKVLPLSFIWLSPSILACLIYTLQVKVLFSSSLSSGLCILSLSLGLLPLLLAVQLVMLVLIPISIMRFAEERDYIYALNLNEIFEDLELMKTGLWRIILHGITDLIIILSLGLTLFLPTFTVLPSWICIIWLYILTSISLGIVTVRTVDRFLEVYMNRFFKS